MKKVISAMIVEKDISTLFPDIVNHMQSDNLELKKLVYLNLMIYASRQADMVNLNVYNFMKIPIL